MTIVGYDSRVRFAYKHLAVSILSYWELREHSGFTTPKSAAERATHKFEALEDGVATRLSILSEIMTRQKDKGNNELAGQRKRQSMLVQSAIRGLKIGAAGVTAGTVIAITGGLATPAIVGGIAALTGIGSATSAVPPRSWRRYFCCPPPRQYSESGEGQWSGPHGMHSGFFIGLTS